MRCEILRTLYVKANGEIPCHDDAGEVIGLGWVPESGELRIADLLESAPYRHLRAELAAGRAPWPETCARCAFLRPDEPFEDGFAQRHLTKIQVEPTLACALGCPGCSRVTQFRERPGSVHLDLDRFERLLRAVAVEGYTVDWIEYCGQGEPLNHREFARYVDAARALLPATRQRLITNGNHRYDDTVGESALDEIIVSIDGAIQANYEQYRIRGSLDAALRFAGDAVARARGRTHVIWKYILFDHNDSDEELRTAQSLARDLGVDVLLFVVTHSEGRSRRYDVEHLADVLLVAPSARVGTTPILERGNAVGRLDPVLTWAPETRSWRRPGPPPELVLDDVLLLADRTVSLRGWAAAGSGSPVEVSCRIGDGEAAVVSGLSRPDVPAARRDVVSASVGFAASAAWPSGWIEATPLVFEVEADGRRWVARTSSSWTPRSG